jgi:RNA polymerase sigma factor (sigma-70 family)
MYFMEQLESQDWSIDNLIKKCLENPPNEIAWAEFVRRFNSIIRKNIIKTLQTRLSEGFEPNLIVEDHRVDDLVQGVYVRLIQDNRQAIKKFKGEYHTSIYSYLTAIAVNVVRDYCREIHAIKRPQIAVSLDSLLSESGDMVWAKENSSPEENQLAEVMNEEEQEIVFKLIDEAFRRIPKWKNRDRDVLMFKLRIIHGLKLKEIDTIMGLGLSTVTISSIVNRTLKKIKPVLLATIKKAGEDPDVNK